MRRGLIAAIAALAVVGASGVALGDMFADWDTDHDLYVGEKEWDQGFTEDGVFDEWDHDGDGMLSREEFNSEIFRGYDLSQDRRLSLEEFKAFVTDRDENGVFYH